ncbi:MAG TPA: hypothetical protein VLD19_01010, partial [Chitinophagaceae bacterium]|nr:hypothetical protein [Chitinophagaceae bacterium]
ALYPGVKIIAGCGYGYVYGKYYHGDDTWALNHDALIQYQRLLHEPGLFFADLFSKDPVSAPGLYFQDVTTYAQRLEYAVTTKIMAPFNLVSQGNYYINTVFFSFLSFWGAYLLYKTLICANFSEYLPTPKPIRPPSRSTFARLRVPHSLQLALFLFLPVVFWLSGIRGEGLLLLFSGILLYYFGQLLHQPGIKNSLLCLIGFGLLFIIRSNFAVSLLPALLAWWFTVRFGIKPLKAFAAVYGLLTLAIIASTLLPPQYNALRQVAERQQSFLALHGNTRFDLTPLHNNIGSFLAVAPEALVNTLLRPWPWEAKGALQWLVALENIIVWGLIAWCLARYRQYIKTVFQHPLAWVLLFAALSNYLFIGYVVPFPGAIVRYRAMPELFLLCLLALVMSRKHSLASGE